MLPDYPTHQPWYVIASLKKEGTNFIGRAKLMDTPAGNIAKGLINDGVSLGVSSRGMGTLEEKNGIRYVKEDFHLATAADIVADPSAPDAFVNGIMEGVNWIFDPIKGTWLEEKANDLVKQIHKMPKRQLEEQKLSIFENYIASLTVKNK